MPFEATLNILETEITVLSYHWGASRPDDTGPAVVHDFSFVKHVDPATPALFTMCCSGERADTAVFLARRKTTGPDEVLQYTFTDVAVVAVRPGGSAEARDDMPIEEVTLTFRKCEIDYRRAGESSRGGWPA